MPDRSLQYVYRYALVGNGEEVWKWQQKDTLVWSSADSEEHAIQAIEADAQQRGSTASITDISIMRPRREQPSIDNSRANSEAQEQPEESLQVQQDFGISY